MTNAHETQCKVKTLKTDTEDTNQWEKIIKTRSINVREHHSKYKVLFHNSINIRRQYEIVCAFP